MFTCFLRFVTCRQAHISSVRLLKPAVTDMARAETIESLGDTAGGPFDPHTCCMKLHGAIHLCTNHYLPVLYPGRDRRPRTLPVLSAAPPAPLCLWGQERGEDTARPSALSDSEREEHEEALGLQGPLPDLLPRNSSWALPLHRAPRGQVAYQLRLIGDQFNTVLLHRGHLAPPRPLWRVELQGILNFISQTLSALYRLA